MRRVLLFAAIVAPVLAQQPRFTQDSVLPVWGKKAEPLRPGMLVAIYGSGLAQSTACATPRPPYPRELCGVSVTIAGEPAGLLAVMERQINLQVPQTVPLSGRGAIIVTVGTVVSEAVMVDFGVPVTELSLAAPAYVGMPIWIQLDSPHPFETRYPYSMDPWNFGAGVFEVKGGAASSTVRARMGGISNGLSNGSSAPAGSPLGRLPLHLAFHFNQPGRYAVRFTGSPWLEFDVLPREQAPKQTWLVGVDKRTAGEIVGDLLPSALASPGEWMIPILLDLTHWTGADRHGQQMVQGYAAQCLRAFDEPVAKRMTLEYALKYGPTLGMNAAWLDEAAIRQGLNSKEGWAQAGALEAINAKQTRTMDGDVIAAADAIIRTNDPESTRRLAVVLGLNRSDEARALLRRMATTDEQALICLAWIAHPDDLPLLGEALLRNFLLAYHLDRQYGERSYPYLRRAMKDSKELWVRKESALPLARKGEPEAFATLLAVIAQQPSAQPEIISFGRTMFPKLNDAEVLAAIRNAAR